MSNCRICDSFFWISRLIFLEQSCSAPGLEAKNNQQNLRWVCSRINQLGSSLCEGHGCLPRCKWGEVFGSQHYQIHVFLCKLLCSSLAFGRRDQLSTLHRLAKHRMTGLMSWKTKLHLVAMRLRSERGEIPSRIKRCNLLNYSEGSSLRLLVQQATGALSDREEREDAFVLSINAEPSGCCKRWGMMELSWTCRPFSVMFLNARKCAAWPKLYPWTLMLSYQCFIATCQNMHANS